MRKFWRILAIVLIGFTGMVGLANAAREFDDGGTGLQQSVTFGVALYGVFGVLAAIGMIRRRPWCVTVAAAWAVAVTYVATVASFAYHDPGLQKEGTLGGVLGAFVACVLIAWYAVWAARESARPVILQS